jgi:hypothetical protein
MNSNELTSKIAQAIQGAYGKRNNPTQEKAELVFGEDPKHPGEQILLRVDTGKSVPATMDSAEVNAIAEGVARTSRGIIKNSGVIGSDQIPVMIGATAIADGVSGAVPQPLIADKDSYLKGDGTWATNPLGTVTSVGLSLPSEFTVTNSPVTTSGTLTGTWAVQAKHTAFMGPTGDPAAAPGFRVMDATDLPSHEHDWGDLTSGVPTEFTPEAHEHDWSDLTSGVPTEFPPEAHTHETLTNGDGLTGSDYDGSSPTTWTLDLASANIWQATQTWRANAAGAGTAPMKFQPGTVMATPEAGALEWDGLDLWITTEGGDLISIGDIT